MDAKRTSGSFVVRLLLFFLLAAGGLAPGGARAAPPGQATVVVTLRERADLAALRTLPRAERRRAILDGLRSLSARSQLGLRVLLAVRRAQGQVSAVTPLWISNALSVTATPAVIQELAAHPAVLTVAPDEVPVIPSATAASPTGWNVTAVDAPALWGGGLSGQGVVVASLDTGVDVYHPDLATRWRGGSNSWFDPYGQHPSPYDPSGHGTWTMGLMVGGDASGATIGVAPDARWISAKIFDDSGRATATAIHQAFQWILDPDGDPATDDAPQVVNNSWSYGLPGCNLEFQRDLQALVAAGIAPVFASGNFGPYPDTSTSPANYPEAISVGAVTSSDTIYSSSSRGPSRCTGATYPSVVAPGVGVTTTDLFSFYTTVSGSSVATPHVSGVLALLVEAYPDEPVERLALALQRSAWDLGSAGPDNTFGSGLVAARTAFDDLAAAPPPTPPSATGDAYAAVAGTPLSMAAPGVLANDTSPSGAPLTAVLVTTPAHGTLTLRADGGFDYTGAVGYAGPDGFSYQASDGTLSSAAAAVALDVAPPPSPPVAGDDAYSVVGGSSATFGAPGVLANDSDPAGRPLTASLVSSTTHGQLLFQADGGFSYTPSAGYAGADGFSYLASNGSVQSTVATVSITVTPPPNRPPVALDDAATTRVGSSVTIKVLANDSDPEGALVPGTVTIVAKPASGTAVRNANGTVTYTPARRFKGNDAFTYSVKDAAGAASNTATVRVKVQ